MPRDSSGSMTLSKPPFVNGTTIISGDVNSDLSDIATELTDSLSRSGKGGLLAPLRFLDGTLAAPAIAFTSETGSGWYRVASNVIAWVIAGVERLRVFATGAKVTGTFEATGAATIGGAIGVTGLSTLTGGAYVPAGIKMGTGDPSVAGDIRVQRSATNVGAIEFGSGSHYLSYDGSGPGFAVTDGNDTLLVATPTATGHAATKAYVDTRPSTGAQLSSSSGAFTTTSGSYVSVTNLSVTVTTLGKPVLIAIQSDADSNGLKIGPNASATQTIRLTKGGTPIAYWQAWGSASGVIAGISCIHVDPVAAGTYTYAIETAVTGGVTANLGYAKLAAYEL